MNKVHKPAKVGNPLFRLPVPRLPEHAIRDLAALPCLCGTIKPEREPCTSCRARDALKSRERAS
jgi:hypothetical protein